MVLILSIGRHLLVAEAFGTVISRSTMSTAVIEPEGRVNEVQIEGLVSRKPIAAWFARLCVRAFASTNITHFTVLAMVL